MTSAAPAAVIAAQLTPRPGIPAILRDVHLIEGAVEEHKDANGDTVPDVPGYYTHPIIPPFRTSADGRVGVDMASGKLFLFGPEALGQAITAPDAPAGPKIVLGTLSFPGTAHFYKNSGYSDPDRTISVGDQTICDGTPALGSQDTGVRNPHPCNPADPEHPDPAGTTASEDCYTLTMISVVNDKKACTEDSAILDCGADVPCILDPDPPPLHPDTYVCSDQSVRYWGKSFTVVVEDPKTASAHLKAVELSSDEARSGTAFHAPLMHTPSVTADGRLIVSKLGRSPRDPISGDAREPLDIVYATYLEDPSNPENSRPCDVTKWTVLHPMSHAHSDPEMLDRYGIAAYPFRDPHGTVFADDKDLQVTYPWIDRAGNNLFFTSLQSTLFYKPVDSSGNANGPVQSRCLQQCVAGLGATCEAGDTASPTTTERVRKFEETQNFRGTGVAGLWTHGKMVLLDSAINNIDYGLSRGDANQRDLGLYHDGANATYWVRAGTGKYPGGPAPEHSTGNTSFIDSLEHLFNWNDKLKPFAVRDVVWILNTGKASAELIFDDYLDPNALIVAEMSGALARDAGPNPEYLKYYDGFNQQGAAKVNNTVGREVRFQNAATSPEWNLPTHGAALGDVRVEPVALGGIEGKGAWLDGSGDAISFAIPTQSQMFNQRPWYLSAFIDSRFGDDNVHRKLFTFGNGAGLALVGRSTITYESAAGAVLASISISGMLHTASNSDALQPIAVPGVPAPAGAWNHLAFVLDYPQSRIRLYVNGYLKASTAAVDMSAIPIAGTFYVGDAPNDSRPGFVGWIDEVKLLAYQPTPELACNHARGTLVRVSSSSPWSTQAAAYPQSSHDAISKALNVAIGSKYVCYHTYRDHRWSNPRLIPATLGLTSVREQLNFPQGIHFGTPRPDSSLNPFCLTCHHTGGAGGLDVVNALGPHPLDQLGQLVPMQNDERRQPTMPPPFMFGNVPADFFSTAHPPTDMVDVAIDQYVFP